uniref:Uncharacterized protein n=1 Tax=Gossypium raimondii TaxID=29730 RepID=A0A0D2NNZ3_GOSRA|nr:hypothetical protein B456_006G094000 [Gossypium raimondii]
MVTISISPVAAQSLYIRNARNVPFIPLRNAPFRATTKLSTLAHSSGSISFSPLRFSIKDKEIKKKKKSRGSSAVCYAAPLSRLNLQWISAISSADSETISCSIDSNSSSYKYHFMDEG